MAKNILQSAKEVLRFVRSEMNKIDEGELRADRSEYHQRVEDYAIATNNPDVPFASQFEGILMAFRDGESDDAYEYLEEVEGILEEIVALQEGG